ncbi:MAG: glycosyltransferase family 2 protein [Candidatus Omnitrophica bacterium]|nr:glycosyltransferase family 2 protein [Candidatus Omnitrophota bacterium]
MEKTYPLVYINILNYNGKNDTEEGLDSLKNLDYDNFKILIIDNGSNDGSVEYLRERFPEAEFIENDENFGFAKGNNIGIKYALERQANYILILNNDTVVSPALLKDLLDVATKDTEIGIIGPKILYYHQKDKIWFAGGRILSLLGNSWHIGNRKKDLGRYEGIVDEDYQTGCALMIKREVIEKIGMFDPAYFAYFEDADLCLRARAQGYRVVCVRGAKIWHKISKSIGGGLSPDKAYLKAKSGVRFFRRYSLKIWYYTTIPICVLCYITVRSIYERLRGKPGIFKAYIKGLLQGIRG